MPHFVTTVLLVFAALFPIVNPLGVAPIFATLTGEATPRTRQILAARVAVNGFVLRLGSFFIGSHILDFFGLSLPAVQVGGGLVVTVGPGSIAVAITLGTNTPRASALRTLVLRDAGAVAGIALIAVAIFLSLRFADRIGWLLGENGTSVLVRLSAFILLCIGIQITWNGLGALGGPLFETTPV